MKNKIISLLEVMSPLFLVLGALGLLFSKSVEIGFIVLSLGCVTGMSVIASKSRIDVYEKFHLISCVVGLIIMGMFFFSGIIYKIAVSLVVLFAVDFLILLMDMGTFSGRRKNNRYTKENHSEESSEKQAIHSEKKENYGKFNEEKIYDELENIKDEFAQVQIYEAGDIEDMGDLALKKQAEKIKSDFDSAVIVQDPKEGRFFYKEAGSTFHLKGCLAVKRIKKKDLKSSNSRTVLLAKGYKPCKMCDS